MAAVKPEAIRIDDFAAPKLTEAQRALISGAPTVEMTVDSVLNKAKQDTGLNDFGAEDFKQRLRIWLAAFDEDSGLSPFGRFRCWSECVRYAANRLCLVELEKRHPEIEDIVIDRPIIIAGLPRSGTSNLVNMIAADRRLRSMPFWETTEPLPRPGEMAGAPDRRRERAIANWGTLDRYLPHLQAMHAMEPDYIHEDMELMGPDFSIFYPEWIAHVPRWRDHILTLDQVSHYRFGKRMVKAMTWLQGPNRWVMKSPSHMESLAALATVYPDATVAVLHRDPIAVLQSQLSMMLYNDRLRRSAVDIKWTTDYWLDRLEKLLCACVAQRDTLPAGRSVDVLFHDYMANQLALVRRIYALADLPFTDEAASDIESFIDANPRGKHGQVIYDPINDFGLDIRAARERFQFYYDRFPVKIERVAGEER